MSFAEWELSVEETPRLRSSMGDAGDDLGSKVGEMASKEGVYALGVAVGDAVKCDIQACHRLVVMMRA